MADTYEKDLSQKSSLTVSDFIRVVGSDNVSYKQVLSDVAKKIIENYTGSTLAGANRSIADAIGRAVTYTGNIDTPPSGAWILHAPNASTGTKPPIAGNGYIILSLTGWSGSTLVYGGQLAIGFGNTKVATRYAGYNTSGATWSSWEVLPTRAEMDNVTKKTTVYTLTSSESLIDVAGDDTKCPINSVTIVNPRNGTTPNIPIVYGLAYVNKRVSGTYSIYLFGEDRNVYAYNTASTAWTKLPTRAEIDALNNKLQNNVYSSVADLYNAILNGDGFVMGSVQGTVVNTLTNGDSQSLSRFIGIKADASTVDVFLYSLSNGKFLLSRIANGTPTKAYRVNATELTL